MDGIKLYEAVTEKLDVLHESGRMIRGLIYRPKAEGQFPVVIFSHGFGSNYHALMHHGPAYAQHGIVCAFFDFCGGGAESTSDGSMKDMTVMTEASDLVKVMEKVATLSYVDTSSIYLQGESQGGFVSAIVGRAYQEDVKGLILWYPAFVIPDDARSRIKNGQSEAMGFELSKDYDAVAQDIDVEDLQTGFNKPVLILHGDKDPIVPIEYSRTAAANYGHATLKEIEGAEHGFNEEEGEFAREASIAFIKIYEGIMRVKFEDR
ncbi:alpha/beta hydrolase family protein [Butyrivibrio sp. YAB3001]|uniref:alpha/beta hydrolase family protein n=1 Tax=Butyrivibrio sp. YAB3001 TaxID=1520812 RepID=UPI0008F634B0|nr:alpha/beta fold hydrolase [Butyrivibrio sp. YAB3001]SFC48567.1 hypothetical protein SAMN02910398_02371 [Butyrivibrio sp. YAB3001]